MASSDLIQLLSPALATPPAGQSVRPAQRGLCGASGPARQSWPLPSAALTFPIECAVSMPAVDTCLTAAMSPEHPKHGMAAATSPDLLV